MPVSKKKPFVDAYHAIPNKFLVCLFKLVKKTDQPGISTIFSFSTIHLNLFFVRKESVIVGRS